MEVGAGDRDERGHGGRRACLRWRAVPGEERVVDWRFRWVVSGHWRKQAVKDGHRLTYINPYMKGPADRPLKLPTATVYDVNR